MTEKAEASSQQGIKSIEVGARVLRALERGRGPMSLSEVAKRADLHPAKAHRYLTSLTRTGLASQDASSGLYDLGAEARALGVEAVRRADPVRIASTFAVELRDETGHTTNLSVWSEGGPVLVGWDTGAHLLPIVIRLGSTLPMLDSAVGHVFLAPPREGDDGAGRQGPAAAGGDPQDHRRGARRDAPRPTAMRPSPTPSTG